MRAKPRAAVMAHREVAVAVINRFLIFALLLAGTSVQAAVLPDERIDILYHGYDGGGAQIDGPSILVRKSIGSSVSVAANYYVDMVSRFYPGIFSLYAQQSSLFLRQQLIFPRNLQHSQPTN